MDLRDRVFVPADSANENTTRVGRKHGSTIVPINGARKSVIGSSPATFVTFILFTGRVLPFVPEQTFARRETRGRDSGPDMTNKWKNVE